MNRMQWLIGFVALVMVGCESKPMFSLGYLAVENDRAVFSARPLTPEAVVLLKSMSADEPALAEAFRVIVRSKERSSDTPALLGTYRVTEAAVLFEPRFPLEPGATYEAMLDQSRLPGVEGNLGVYRLSIATEPAPPSPRATVKAVYPTSDALPENLLRLYIHFSAPMSQGDSYGHIHILNERGQKIELPFLELPEELWNDDGTRLTILFDPGRVKQGLKPREEDGAVLEAGKQYKLMIDADWRDASGRPLKASHWKAFKATAADVTQPDPDKWEVKVPPTGLRRALEIRFPDGLDHGMLEHVIKIVNADGQRVRGKVSIGESETQWTFIPDEAWRAGLHTINVPHTLEDCAGNSVGRPFEVDLNAGPRQELRDRALVFEVK
ncbi:MAG: hypothetical protein WD768_05370 [Phycisphaeraceae bacterium]